jgi:hypothetical protein
VRFFALGKADALRAQNLQGRRGGQGKAAMGAVNEAGAFNYRSGQHAWFAEQLERNTRADDIDDRIDGAHLVKVNLFGRQAVDPAFRHGDALKDGIGLLLHPFGQGAARDELPDRGQVPTVTAMRGGSSVMIVIVTVTVIMRVVVMVFDELGLALFGSAAAFDAEDGPELMRLG